MLHHRTTNLKDRVHHIAEREANKLFEIRHEDFFKDYDSLYDEIWIEFIGT